MQETEQLKPPGAVWVDGRQLNELQNRTNLFSPDGSILITPSAEGQALQIPPSGAGGGGITVEITFQFAFNKYQCDVYGDGYYDDSGTPKAATAGGQALWITQIASGETVPNGSRLTAAAVENHYEAPVPRWL